MKGIILDIDGVLVRGKEIIKGSPEAVRSFLGRGMTVTYLTNNSTMTNEQTLMKLRSMGFPTAFVIGSAFAAATYIKEEFGPARCLVVGEMGLLQELVLAGHEAIMAGDGNRSFDFVVAGLDRTLTYSKIDDALHAIRGGARFIATNRDPTLPVEKGEVQPGAGAVVAAISTCSGVDPIVVGKPDPYSTELALKRMGLQAEEVLVVGDRIDTDIAAGRAAGCHVALVRTGDMVDLSGSSLPVYRDLLELSEEILRKGK
ncbi:MAG: HAD-IIA family hydrolase [Candidatus Thermoplasmatota archaeon]|nr:HAD-IIA family hydrolase [Candidatus Thermoplasmatota archaeon]